MPAPKLSRPLSAYYDTLRSFDRQGAATEGATRIAFQNLLADIGRQYDFTVLGEQRIQLPNKRSIQLDGEVKDRYKIRRGIWEAKDSADDLDLEIRKKIAAGYPTTNIIFENTRRAVLYQNGAPVLDVDIREPANLQRLLDQFFAYSEPQIEQFHHAVAEFRKQIPDLAQGLTTIIETERRDNRTFEQALTAFWDLCKASLNPATTAFSM